MYRIVCVFLFCVMGCQTTRPEIKGSVAIEHDIDTNKSKAVLKMEWKL